MDILSKLPFLGNDAEDSPVESKQERIDFHRRMVRNGPTSFRTLTGGQVRRARERALEASTRKARRRQIRRYLAEQQEAAAIRGNLQAAGVLPYFDESHRAAPQAALSAVIWIVQRFAEGDEEGRVEVTEDVVRQSLQAALNRWQAIVGMPVTALSPAYVLPVRVAG